MAKTNGSNGSLKIDKGIPIPESGIVRKGHAEILRRMNVGDSILMPIPHGHTARNAAMYALGKGNFVTRKVDGGFRIWRTK